MKAPRKAKANQPVSSFPKQAVVVIHGMGEQIPMDTIRGFVRAAWETDDVLTANGLPHPSEVWSKPDLRTGSLELRRITTRQSIPTATFAKGVRTDFYELYWADLSGGSTWHQVQAWISVLLLRNPFKNVPKDVFVTWLSLWAVTLTVTILLAAAAIPSDAKIGTAVLWQSFPLEYFPIKSRWLLGILAAGLGAFATYLIVPYFGRVVRYTRSNPDNIAARKNIRERGLNLLNALHDNDYERIIVVGHSLGSMLAYDLLSYCWASRMGSHTIKQPGAEFEALKELEDAVAALDRSKKPKPAAIADFHDAQTKLGHLLRCRPKPPQGGADTRWLITDFVTLGCPLSHADFLVTRDRKELEQKKGDRELPTSPPLREELDPDTVATADLAGFTLDPKRPRLLSFPFGPGKNWQLHHATPFAATRWTNIFDPSFLVLMGDVISGPVAPLFGPGVVDVDLRKLRGQSFSFTHTKYWLVGKNKKAVHLTQLRQALDLGGERRKL